VAASALLLHHMPRWQADDRLRQRQLQEQAEVARMLAAPQVALQFANGETAWIAPRARGYAGLGWAFWPLACLALLLYLMGLVVALARPQAPNVLYAVAAGCQAANLMLIALETSPGIGLPPGLLQVNPAWRLALDTCTGAAVLHAWALTPTRLPNARVLAAAAWTAALPGAVLLQAAQPAGWWWWQQALCLALCAGALAVIHHSHTRRAHPYAAIMRRFGAILLATLVLATLAVASTTRLPGLAMGVAEAAAITWYLFLASLLLLTPFLERSRQVLREFALLAGISTVATSVDLLFVSVFSVGTFTSLAVALFLALAVYAAARQAILQRLLGRSLLTTERTFEKLYRAARDVQAHPQRYPAVLARLMGELFDPLETQRLDRPATRARVLDGGSALLVPLRPAGDGGGPAGALALRHAQRGQRLFTLDDARLADRVVQQLQSAVAYDQAVEQGRHEERLRIAQDLHDDIGARLLTMMYQARSREDEDYIRHTLQDLKTLTRGLAAAQHRLSHAAAEWKSDIDQRMSAARGRLHWTVDLESDLVLSVVQWSALTRVLRELVSNALFHGQASRLEVHLQLQGGALTLRVADNGSGSMPEAWAHGLGLGGVRKRIKLLGGQVQWQNNTPCGILCTVVVPELQPTLQADLAPQAPPPRQALSTPEAPAAR
jgi:signal transduction histidine kinase